MKTTSLRNAKRLYGLSISLSRISGELAAMRASNNLALDFATQSRDDAVQNERLSAEVIAAAASMGMEIEMSIYPPNDEP
ncbi:MAG: hypothetical protein JO051_12015 [Acidobacteriaceae bacterium]|nr:hypothetical protein [Acidobacteriaceae bacterium]